MSILMNREVINNNKKDTKLLSEILGAEVMSKMTETEVENRELKITTQNLVNVLRDESNRSKKLSQELILTLQDLQRLIRLTESDHESEEEMNTMDVITAKYKDINQRIGILQQSKTQYQQVQQITNRASMKVGGIEKYEMAQFTNDAKMYFDNDMRSTVL